MREGHLLPDIHNTATLLSVNLRIRRIPVEPLTKSPGVRFSDKLPAPFTGCVIASSAIS